jgi:hypothetical protein
MTTKREIDNQYYGCGTKFDNVEQCSQTPYRFLYSITNMRKIIAIIAALITGGIGLVSVASQAAEAALTQN